MKKKSGNMALWMNLATAAGLVAMAAFIIYGIRMGIFTSKDTMNEFLGRFGIWAPLIFVLIQAIQVVIPILPGAIGCLGGVLIFGPLMGFVYNYIGICVGSMIAFLLARQYGKPFVKGIANERLYNKYIGWLDRGKKFDVGFALAIFFPVAPDDFLCYLAGLTKMTFRKFAAIILLAKPASIALYSMGLSALGQLVIRAF